MVHTDYRNTPSFTATTVCHQCPLHITIASVKLLPIADPCPEKLPFERRGHSHTLLYSLVHNQFCLLLFIFPGLASFHMAQRVTGALVLPAFKGFFCLSEVAPRPLATLDLGTGTNSASGIIHGHKK